MNNESKNSINEPSTMTSRPELLAPAGTMAAFHAAINAGADAVYFGLGAFNARGEAANLQMVDLDELTSRAALYKVKTYLTLNTLLSDEELPAALDLAARAYAAGVDAVILQDKGLALALKRYLPDLALHGSTQMTLTHPEALYEAQELGLKRVILPRELSAEELAVMVPLARQLGLETEIFVHGALCVCVSGQCGLSYFNGGRSANRGACAQACRLDYELELDGRLIKEGPLLSPKDQSLLTDLAAIRDLGIDSIKIEGRRRSATYVGSVCSIYRTALDQMQPGQSTVDASAEKDLLLAFNRGGRFTRNWFGDERSSDFMSGAWPGSYGIKLGPVVASNDSSGELVLRCEAYNDLKEDLLPGSVVALRDEYSHLELASAPIGKITYKGGLLSIKAFHPQILRTIKPGHSAFLMQSKSLSTKVEQAKAPHPRRVDFSIFQDATRVYLRGTNEAYTATTILMNDASYPELTEQKLQKSLDKLGGTPFHAGKIDTAVRLHLPLSALNQARREVCARLEQEIIAAAKRKRLALRYDLRDFSDIQESIVAQAGNRSAQKNSPGRLLFVQSYRGELGALQEQEEHFDKIVIPLGYLEADAQVFERVLHDTKAHYELALPVILGIRDRQNWSKILRELCQRAPRVLHCPAAGAKAWCAEIENLSWTLDSGSQVMNRLSALWALAQGSRGLSFADELSSEGIRSIVDDLAELYSAWALDPQSIEIELQVSGPRRAMYCRQCSLGMRLKGCRACHGKKAVLVQSSNGLEQGLIFHPEADCCTELLLEQRAKNEANQALAATRAWPLGLVLRYNDSL